MSQDNEPHSGNERRRKISAKDIQGLKYFRVLRPLMARLRDVGTARDRAQNRQLRMDHYCTLVLLWLYSPIVDSLRGLQQASQLKKVQQKLKIPRASLGALSESVKIFDPEPLKRIARELADQLPEILGDNVQLQQVALNLVMNAIEAMHSMQARILRIETRQSEPGMVRVSVEDSGTGIEAADLDRIFNPLFTTKSSGMGMGLSICRSIIESHGGRIWVSNAAGQGTVFQFELPAESRTASQG